MERVIWKLTLPYVKQRANGNLLYVSGNSNRDRFIRAQVIRLNLNLRKYFLRQLK